MPRWAERHEYHDQSHAIQPAWTAAKQYPQATIGLFKNNEGIRYRKDDEEKQKKPEAIYHLE